MLGTWDNDVTALGSPGSGIKFLACGRGGKSQLLSFFFLGGGGGGAEFSCLQPCDSLAVMARLSSKTSWVSQGPTRGGRLPVNWKPFCQPMNWKPFCCNRSFHASIK